MIRRRPVLRAPVAGLGVASGRPALSMSAGCLPIAGGAGALRVGADTYKTGAFGDQIRQQPLSRDQGSFRQDGWIIAQRVGTQTRTPRPPPLSVGTHGYIGANSRVLSPRRAARIPFQLAPWPGRNPRHSRPIPWRLRAYPVVEPVRTRTTLRYASMEPRRVLS